jgi:hypothetical protein
MLEVETKAIQPASGYRLSVELLVAREGTATTSISAAPTNSIA